ncbi:MAG: phosphomannomutase [Clostridia bacterium]|nr:phosphomannomutase [Clostridia bacterium]
MSKKPIQLFAFDLDGTLTQHKTPLEPEARAALEKLRAVAPMVMMGAGNCMRIFNQLEQFPIDVVGNYGMQRMDYDAATGTLKPVYNRCIPLISHEEANRRVDILRKEFGVTEYAGNSVEFHDSGVLTFALLGTAAKQEDKLAFDPDRSRRRPWYPRVIEMFPEYNVFVGGSSSFDLAPKPCCKSTALKEYCDEKGIDLSAVRYFGDDYGPGGNDSDVLNAGIPFVKIDNYRTFPKIAEDLLKSL